MFLWETNLIITCLLRVGLIITCRLEVGLVTSLRWGQVYRLLYGGAERSDGFQESSVPQGGPARPIHFDSVLVMIQHLNYNPSSVPLLSPPPSLVLDKDHLGHVQGLQGLGVLSENYSLLSMPAGQGNLPLFSGEEPLSSWLEVLWVDRKEVLDGVAKDDLGRAPACVPVRGVAVGEEGSEESV